MAKGHLPVVPVKQGAGLSDAERHPEAFAAAQSLRQRFAGDPAGLEAEATRLIQVAVANGNIQLLDDAVRARRMIRYGVW